MKILCVICHDLLAPSDDIFFTRCGHVFHHRCLSQWLERSKTCPQCRDIATVNRIHKAHFTVSNTDVSVDNGDNLTVQGRIDSLQFQILLNEKNVKHYTSKNVILEKQNAGLRQEVRKVESEIRQKNSTIYALKEQINYFKDKYLQYDILKEKLSKKEREVDTFRDMYKTLSMSTLKDVQEMVGNITDRNTLINYISIMKKIMSKKTKKIADLQDQLVSHRKSVEKEHSKSLDLEVRFAFCESENLALRQRVNVLEKLLTSDQNCVTKSSNQRNSDEKSLITIPKVDICSQQINTKQETTDQNDSSASDAEVEIITDANQENSAHYSTPDECPVVTKKARLCLQSGNSSNKTNGVITNDVKNTVEKISSQLNVKTSQKKMKLKSVVILSSSN